MRLRRNAFTLVELIVVVIVLGILIAVVLPNFYGAAKGAQDATARAYLSVLYRSCKNADGGAWQNAANLLLCGSASEPELSFQPGDCVIGAAQPAPKDLTVDPTSSRTAGMITYSHSQSSKTFRIWASDSSGPLINEVGCGLDGNGNRIGNTDRVIAPPSVSGTMQEGSTLSVAPGTWPSGMSTSVQWISCDTDWRNCAPISGATGPSYQVQPTDISRKLAAIVTGTDNSDGAPYPIVATEGGDSGNGGGGNGGGGNGGGGNGPVLAAPPQNTHLPNISGDAVQGSTLTLGAGAWTSTKTPLSYAYSWYDCVAAAPSTCATIDGATGTSYVVSTADIGYVLRGAVVASNGDASSNKVFSTPTATVQGAVPVFTYGPTVGAPNVGTQLSYTYALDGGTIRNSTGAPPAGITISDHWYICTSSTNCVDASPVAVPPTPTDCTHAYKVAVTATKTPGGSATATSPISAFACGGIVYSGPNDTYPHNPDIFFMNGDGSGVTDLTNAPTTSETSPVLSPAGTKIAYLERDASGTPIGLYEMNADGSDKHLVTSGSRHDLLGGTYSNVNSPNFSPDGTQIAYTDIYASGGTTSTGIFTIAASTRNDTHGGAQQNTSSLPISGSAPEAASQLDWTSRGIFFIAGSREFAWTCRDAPRKAGTNSWMSGNYPAAVNAAYPGRTWPVDEDDAPCDAYGSLPTQETRYPTVWLLSGGTVSQLTSYPTRPSDNTADYWPRLSPDGGTLLYTHTGATNPGLRLRNMTTGAETLVPGLNGSTALPALWSRDGTQLLAYTGSYPYPGKIYTPAGTLVSTVASMLGGSPSGWDWSLRSPS